MAKSRPSPHEDPSFSWRLKASIGRFTICFTLSPSSDQKLSQQLFFSGLLLRWFNIDFGPTVNFCKGVVA